MDFGEAIRALKDGKRVARAGWNGNRRPAFHVPDTRAPVVAFGLVWILLNDGQVAVCDGADFGLVRGRTWTNLRGYPSYTDSKATPRTTVKLHQVLFPNAEMVDHVNGDPLDNRRENLRPCSAAENVANSRAREGSSKFKGVSWDSSRSKWIVSMQSAQGTRHLGRFDDEIEAARAYDLAAKEAHGAFARLNFPEPRMWLMLVKPMKLASRAAEPEWLSGPTYALRVPVREDAAPAWAAARLETARREDPNAELRLVDWKGDDELLPFIAMFTADRKFVPWLASQTDMLAEDWSEAT